MKLKKLVFFCAIAMCLFITACGSSSSSSSSSSSNTSSNDNKSQSTSSAGSPFEFYNKITLGMTKDQVDATLGVTPVPETSQYALKNSFNYKDKDENGVSICYNDKNEAYSKTVIYDSHSVLAKYTPKAVTNDQCNKIKSGMSKDEVNKILGGDGVECSRTSSECMKTSNSLEDFQKYGLVIRWGNKDGSCVQVTYKDDGTVEMSYFYSGN